MRRSAVDDCLKILKHFGVDQSCGQAIDIGGTETVYLDTAFARNPLFAFSSNLTFLDKGFNVDVLKTKADDVVDFLDVHSITHLKSRFDLVYCFDTLEHVSNPFLFCQNLICITKPGGYVYVATVFDWPYHPSPEDYFRFSPPGLRELFENPADELRDEFVVLWCGWGSDRRGVALLGRRSDRDGSSVKKHDPALSAVIEELLGHGKPLSDRENNPQGSTALTKRVWRFLWKPWLEKEKAVRYIFGRLSNKLTFDLVRLEQLPCGSRVLVWPDVMGQNIRRGGFEENERCFVEQFLKPGMVVFDVGAHSGFYTLLAADRVGKTGHVVAFEPSPRECRRLRWNLILNWCANVRVERIALGACNGQTDFFVVLGKETGCNSMRPPVVDDPVDRIKVHVMAVDGYCSDKQIGAVDFIKLDAEGAELEVLKGARGLLVKQPRPVLMCELVDIRTTPWGYRAQEIYEFLAQLGYTWFSVEKGGYLCLAPSKDHYHENLVAVPEERMSEVRVWIGRG